MLCACACVYDVPRTLIKVDSSLSFLDDYVVMALSRGKSPYKPASQRMETVTGLLRHPCVFQLILTLFLSTKHAVKELPKSAGIKFQPYQLTTPSTVVTNLLPAAITTVPEPTTPTTLIRGQPAASVPTETLGIASGLTVPDSGYVVAAIGGAVRRSCDAFPLCTPVA